MKTQVLSESRVGLVQRVYGLLSGCLGIAATASFFGMSLPATIVWPLFAVSLMLIFALHANYRNYPANIALMTIFAAVEGLSLGPLIGMYVGAGKAYIVTEALVITAMTFTALTAYVFWSKDDFNYLGGFLFTLLIGLIVTGFVGIIFGMSKPVYLMYCYAGVIVFIGYVLYDTSELIHRYREDEYVIATMALFLDILNLFVNILQILGTQKEE